MPPVVQRAERRVVSGRHPSHQRFVRRFPGALRLRRRTGGRGTVLIEVRRRRGRRIHAGEGMDCSLADAANEGTVRRGWGVESGGFWVNASRGAFPTTPRTTTPPPLQRPRLHLTSNHSCHC